MKTPTVRFIFLIWLGWALLVIGFQFLATSRFQPTWPDRAQQWTETETAKNNGDYQRGRACLLEPFMNNQVAWDSEYYLGIAVGGYDDPLVPALTPRGWMIPGAGYIPKTGYQGETYSLSYDARVGVALVIPMGITWIRTREWYALDLEWRQIYLSGIPLRPLFRALLAFAPLIAFLIWKFSYLGFAFDYVETNFFGRGFLQLDTAFYAWASAWYEMAYGFFTGADINRYGMFVNSQRSAYYFTELVGFVVALLTCWRARKEYPELAWFSLAVFIISWGSGPAQGIHRYVLACPAMFVMLAKWGKNPAFDRTWTTTSLLLMALLFFLSTSRHSLSATP